MVKTGIPITEKVMLTFEEAAAYSGIGVNRLRDLAKGRGCSFVFYVGKKCLIKRKAFEEFIENNSGI